MADKQQLAAALSGSIQATPRNPVLGGVADLLGMAYKLPEMPRMGVPGIDFLAANRKKVLDLLGMGDVQKTAEALAYGNRLGTGGGMTYRLLPETMGAAMAVAPFVGKAIRATEGLPVGMGIKPINLEKGIYRPELTMEEMLKVKDIPTVERVRKSMELVGEKEFENMVNAQFKKYKPTNQDTEAMLVESVTLNILGKAQRAPYPQQAALDLAEQRAALPVEQGGLGLLESNTLMSIPSGLTRAEQANLIQSQAENFAAKAKKMGLSASVEHSGSKAGPSSYVSISDPITGKKFESPFRFSGHSKGPTQNQFVYDVGNDFSKELNLLENMASSIPKAERDAIQSARQAKMLEELALAEKERLFSQGRPAVQQAMQEANLQQAPYTKAFSNSGNYLGGLLAAQKK